MAANPTQIVILGGGFAGVFAARRLEKLLANRAEVRVTLVSRDNFLLMTPLMFEACSGTLEIRHCSVAIRQYLRTARFVEARVESIDLERRIVHAVPGEGAAQQVAYDHLILALGATTNMTTIPGSEHAFTFKTLADAIVLRNHIIERLERADVECDAAARKRLLTIVIIGGGLVGTEVFGELTAFMETVMRYYPRIEPGSVRLVLLQAHGRIMPEVSEKLAAYAAKVLSARPGVTILTNSEVQAIEPGKVRLKDQTIEAATIVLSAGIVPSPVVARLPVEKDKRGHVIVDGTMRMKSRPEVWALGDCASVPDPDGKPYPKLAQHAMREAKMLADNIHAVLNGKPAQPFVFKTLGLMAALGNNKGLGTALGINLRGFFAWWVRRTYYLSVMPHWAQRIRIVADWTIALFFRPEITKVDLAREVNMIERTGAAGAMPQNAAAEQ